MGIKKETPSISDIAQKTNDERKVQCASCGKIFKYKSELRVHVEVMHLKIKDHLCDQCDKSFSTKSYLNNHLSTHSEKKYTCLMCGMKLSRKEL